MVPSIYRFLLEQHERTHYSFVLSVWNYCCGHRPHLLDLLSDLFAIPKKEKMRHIYFVKLATRKQRKSLGKYQFFLGLFLALKRAANVRVISPNGRHIPPPTIGRRGVFCAHTTTWDGSLPCLITLRCKFPMPTTCNLFDKETKWREFSEF